ncbi:MAG: hypothetical protein K0S33_1009 [Bacteroidetes bacterium]|jgi:hypothetical protein|nr:hypothetical protein [Bacteroidota bacterium]
MKCALKLSGLTPESKVTRTQGIKNDMMGSGYFPNSQLPIGYTGMQTLIDNMQNAIIASNSGTSASIAYMHEQERILVTAFNLVKAHVEFIANTSPNPETIITAAGFTVSQSGGASPVTELTLTATGNSEVVVKVPRHTDEKAFVYEKSTDGETFTKVIATSLSSISITGHAPGSTIYVRYYAIGKNGESPVSAIKSVMVI